MSWRRSSLSVVMAEKALLMQIRYAHFLALETLNMIYSLLDLTTSRPHFVGSMLIDFNYLILYPRIWHPTDSLFWNTSTREIQHKHKPTKFLDGLLHICMSELYRIAGGQIVQSLKFLTA
jgi:hypothetical protein